MNDTEKSALLLTAMGLEVMKTGYGDPELWRDGAGKLHAENLYLPRNMALAGRCIEWLASADPVAHQKLKDWIQWEIRTADMLRTFNWLIQPQTLDKILSLAIEVGLIEVRAKD